MDVTSAQTLQSGGQPRHNRRQRARSELKSAAAAIFMVETFCLPDGSYIVRPHNSEALANHFLGDPKSPNEAGHVKSDPVRANGPEISSVLDVKLGMLLQEGQEASTIGIANSRCQSSTFTS